MNAYKKFDIIQVNIEKSINDSIREKKNFSDLKNPFLKEFISLIPKNILKRKRYLNNKYLNDTMTKEEEIENENLLPNFIYNYPYEVDICKFYEKMNKFCNNNKSLTFY